MSKAIVENLKGGGKIIICGAKGEISEGSMKKIKEFVFENVESKAE